jgi:hypothetical protein
MVYPLIIFGLSDRYEASPLYTTLPDGSKAEIVPDASAYVFAIVVGIPLFVSVLAVPFIYHYCFDKKNTIRGSRRRY